MAAVLVKFDELISADGGAYRACACGRQREDELWEAWIEFEPLSGGETLRTGRETTQPNFTDLQYWATGLSKVYLEGALTRALNPPREQTQSARERPMYSSPAPRVRGDGNSGNAILDPFSVYEKSPELLIKELRAFRAWHLQQIARTYDLADGSTRLDAMSEPELASFIVERVAAMEQSRRRG